MLRWFCLVYFRQVPDDTTLIRWAATIRPETVHVLNDRVVQLAAQAKVTKGRKLRVDATCVATNIHHPTDSGLIVDSIRTLSRLLQRAKPTVTSILSNVGQVCRSRLRIARHAAQSLHRLLRRKSEEKLSQQKELYRCLITSAEQMVRQAERVVHALAEQSGQAAQRLHAQLQQVLPLIRRVISRTRVRVLEGNKVASEEKVLSLRELHMRAIPDTKAERWSSLADRWCSMRWKAAS